MRLLRSLVVAVLALGPVALVVPPAGAATCSSSGVSVVVDYRELGGSTVTACVSDGGGKSATAILASAGVAITYAQRQPGFVCRVNGVPTTDPCVNTSPTDAFWGLWWSDGSRPWAYSSSGVGSLTVPDGGSVGWSWQQDRPAGSAVPPAVAAPPSPSPSPSTNPSTSPSTNPSTSPSTSPPSTPSPSPAKTSSPEPTKAASSRSSPSPSPVGTPTSPGTPPPGESPGDPAEGEKPDSAQKAKSPRDPQRKGQRSGSGEVEASEPATEGIAPDAASGESGASADEPTRVPAAMTWGIVALLGVAVVVSAVVSRRRRRA